MIMIKIKRITNRLRRWRTKRLEMRRLLKAPAMPKMTEEWLLVTRRRKRNLSQLVRVPIKKKAILTLNLMRLRMRGSELCWVLDSMVTNQDYLISFTKMIS